MTNTPKKAFVSKRLIDLFPFSQINYISPKIPDTEVYYLFSKDLMNWYTFDIQNNTWKIAVSNYRLKEGNLDDEQLIIDNGISLTDLNALTWDQLKLLWSEENYNPNFLAIAYSFTDPQNFIFINKFKTNSNWKNSMNRIMNEDVTIKITDDIETDYRFLPPVPLISEGITTAITITQEDIDTSELFGIFKIFDDSNQLIQESLPSEYIDSITFSNYDEYSIPDFIIQNNLNKTLVGNTVTTFVELDDFYTSNTFKEKDKYSISSFIIQNNLNKTLVGNTVAAFVELDDFYTSSTYRPLDVYLSSPYEYKTKYVLTHNVYNKNEDVVFVELDNFYTSSTYNPSDTYLSSVYEYKTKYALV